MSQITERSRLSQCIANSKIFIQYNNRRIEYFRDYLPPAKRDVFDLLPLFFHEDCPLFPGGDPLIGAPSGISNYSPASATRECAARCFRGFAPPRRAKRNFPILFMAIMGSSGSIAFTEDSDMDIWIGLQSQEEHSEESYSLKEKAAAIEQWAQDTADLEVHFFVAPVSTIRNDNYGELDSESCGSALGKLLKEEFYRTALFIAGKVPLYWAMPVSINSRSYDSHRAGLFAFPAFPGHDFIDLGPVGRVSQEEYLSATLWQLLKALRSPFK
ncbi:MAG: adenylate cyclase, partial [Chitinivibrionales bacterium]|nr:adenylate cyclase [Chitinivibrionales bacterium]